MSHFVQPEETHGPEVQLPTARRTEEANAKRQFHTIDGLRGIAALVIVIWHGGPALFGVTVPTGYLAVDLFFLMSGFIISFVYDHRLQAGMGVIGFMRARVIRLYPLYALGTLLGAAVVALHLITSSSTWTWPHLASAVAAGALMLPIPPPPGILPIFPLNGPAWSLFYEMVANVFYVALFPYLSIRRLTLLVLFGVFAICISVLIFGEVGGGALVGRADLYTGGFARVGFSFFAGVLMCRLYRAGDLPPVKFPGAWLILLTLACALVFDPRGARPLYDLLLVVIGFPLLLAGAVHTEPRRWTVFLTALGIVSYPIYATHEVILKVAHRALKLLSHAGTPISPLVSGVIIGSILFVIGWILDRFFDQPLRRWLAARFISKQHPT